MWVPSYVCTYIGALSFGRLRSRDVIHISGRWEGAQQTVFLPILAEANPYRAENMLREHHFPEKVLGRNVLGGARYHKDWPEGGPFLFTVNNDRREKAYTGTSPRYACMYGKHTCIFLRRFWYGWVVLL